MATPQDPDHGAYFPSPAEIEAACALLQSQWTEEERLYRQSDPQLAMGRERVRLELGGPPPAPFPLEG